MQLPVTLARPPKKNRPTMNVRPVSLDPQPITAVFGDVAPPSHAHHFVPYSQRISKGLTIVLECLNALFFFLPFLSFPSWYC